jgi:hypothetical protein
MTFAMSSWTGPLLRTGLLLGVGTVWRTSAWLRVRRPAREAARRPGMSGGVPAWALKVTMNKV